MTFWFKEGIYVKNKQFVESLFKNILSQQNSNARTTWCKEKNLGLVFQLLNFLIKTRENQIHLLLHHTSEDFLKNDGHALKEGIFRFGQIWLSLNLL